MELGFILVVVLRWWFYAFVGILQLYVIKGD